MKWGLAVLAFAIRLAAISLSDHAEFGDARDYLDTATALCKTGAYPDQGNLPFFRAPGLPFFIALSTACDPQRVGLVKIALALVDSATVALIVLISGSLWAGLAAALYPLFIVSTTDVRSEPLFMFLLVLALYGLQRRKPALCGASLALAALTRPVALIFVPLFAVRRPRTFLLAFALVLAPWTIRNYVRYGEFILVNNAGGYSLWRGTHPEMARIYSIRDREEYRRATIEFEQRYADRPMQALTPRARSAEWRDAALANIRAHPRVELLFTLKKAWIYWRPWLNPQEYSFKIVLATGIVTTALYVLASFGFARMERRVVLWVAAFFIVGWIAHLPHQVVTRFRYPLTDPLLIMAASLAIPPRIARFRTSTRPQQDQTAPAEILKTAPSVP
ncbi:MAG TPA: hypothetical protein VKB93_29800 [Thermoanaerobaculia bacterium]|nr:hypothetical protein [Thermoanaerobaculia bacterium]